MVDGVADVSVLSDLRFMVGRSGSSAGVLPVDAVEVPVVELSALSDLRFIVGRSGSSVEVEAVEVVEVGVVLELEVSAVEPSDRRFMVGRFGSSLVAVASGLVLASA